MLVLNCPICGTSPVWFIRDTFVVVQCDECSTSATGRTVAEAAKIWNADQGSLAARGAAPPTEEPKP